MFVELTISGLDRTERLAREIIAKVEDLRKMVKDIGYGGVNLTVEMKDDEKDAASGN